jgi:hypothetical protein
MDAPDAGSADRVIPIGIGLLVKLGPFVGSQRASV